MIRLPPAMFRRAANHQSRHRLVIIGVLWLIISACGSPTSPSPPDVQGFWHGGWVADSCTGLTPYCDYAAPYLGGFNLRLTQSDRTLRAFIYVCGNELDPVTGMVATDGTIALSGQGVLPPYEPMTLSSFHATISGTSMTGTFACTVTISGLGSTYSLTGTLKDVDRFSHDPNVIF
jgi:hypothetical protein